MEAGDDEERTLQALLEASRTPEGRSRLASAGTLAAVLPLLSSSPPRLLLPRLRLLRNLCAGEAATVWARFFPAGFLVAARARDPAVCGTLCMLLDTCCSAVGGRGRLAELCEVGRGLPIVLETISTASTVGYQQEWLEWLLTKICIEEHHLSLLFQKLGSQIVSDGSGGAECRSSSFTREQAFLLQTLSKCLSGRPGEVMVTNDFAFGVLNLLKEASDIVDFNTRGSSALPTGSPTIDVLGYLLAILRDICAWEGPSTTEPFMDLLISAGLIQLLLGFLRELEPPSIVRRSIAQARDQVLPPTTTEPIKVCPYQGFRRDVVSVIGNCVHRRKLVQDEIRKQNGIPILMQQCVVDEDNPFLREWGLFAVRNLLEGNEENQREVADLQLQEPINTPEIAGLGLRVEIDEKNRRAKLVNIS